MFQQEALIPEMHKLQKFALRLTRNATDAADLVQATLLRALEKKALFEEGTNLFGWTSKIMFNQFVSNYRHKNKFETQYDPEHYIGKASVAPAQEASVDLVTVTEKMKLLNADYRQVLLLVCVKGLRYEEVSEFLQIPVGTVRSRLSRARAELREIMASPVPPLPQKPYQPVAAETSLAA